MPCFSLVWLWVGLWAGAGAGAGQGLPAQRHPHKVVTSMRQLAFNEHHMPATKAGQGSVSSDTGESCRHNNIHTTTSSTPRQQHGHQLGEKDKVIDKIHGAPSPSLLGRKIETSFVVLVNNLNPFQPRPLANGNQLPPPGCLPQNPDYLTKYGSLWRDTASGQWH